MLIILLGSYFYYLTENPDRAAQILIMGTNTNNTTNIFSLITNLFSCFILGMVIRNVHIKATMVQPSMELDTEEVDEENKINKVVFVSHIGVTLAFSITQTTAIFTKTYLQNTRIDSAFYFFGGLADIFLSIMLWFVLRENKKKTVVSNGKQVYAVRGDVITGDYDSTINLNDVDDQAEEEVVNPNTAIS